VSTTLAEVLRHFGPEFLHAHTLSTAQAKVWRAILACRTPALGGQRLVCEGCGVVQWRWHSCRNRHCPQCQSREREAWRAARVTELLNVPYVHLVFTLPHEINALAGVHARWVYDTLMHTAAATLGELAADERWLGGMGAFTLVLHTWTQDLRRHVHVHALMACGALAAERWVQPKRSPTFLFPVHALSRVFRGKFLDALSQASRDGKLPRDPCADDAQRHAREQALRRHDWVVYAKAPLAGPAAALDYLSRYTHRNAVGHERIVGIDGDAVRLRVRDNHHGGKRKVVRIAGTTFVERFMSHVLPGGLERIRHFGLLAPAAKVQRLAAARAALAMPPPNPRASEDAQAFIRRVAAIDIDRCPCCRIGRLVVVEVIEPRRDPVAATPPCRGPPG
jgi:hypothetical protein